MPKNPTDIHVGNRLRAARVAQALTQQQLAAMTGICFQQIHKYETAGNRISASRLVELAGVLAVDAAYFFEGLGDPSAAAPASATALRYAKMLDAVPDGPVKREIVDLIKACHAEAESRARDRRGAAERRRRKNGTPQSGDRRRVPDRRDDIDVSG